jgi:hypothetical protein
MKSKLAKKALNPKSPYFLLMPKVESHFKLMMTNTSSLTPEDVAKVILQAVTFENPQLRYTVGNDIAIIIPSTPSMSYEKIRNLIKHSFYLHENNSYILMINYPILKKNSNTTTYSIFYL